MPEIDRSCRDRIAAAWQHRLRGRRAACKTGGQHESHCDGRFLEADFDKLSGVIATESGYTGGKTPNPTYHQVGAGGTGHTEAVRVSYDPAKLNYQKLVDYFWRHIDPTVKDRQFCDIGSQYRSAIYWQNEAERKIVEASRDALLKSGKLPQVLTEIAAASAFYPAEEYHQDYYKKNPIRYAYYRRGCGRDARVHEIWGGK